MGRHIERILWNMTARDIAELAGVSESSVYFWMQGKVMPKFKYLNRIAIATGRTVEDLYRELEIVVQKSRKK